ncbi:MAG TPA: baseplate J/gp47 family protein [Pedobacter sp.]|uniref:baseplate J/gp47 family protein n=1 Tax=Pedobacter sp. TaxID=1411316 RepID=UPI002CDF14EB|nr:baseplate J/gp47 family protein [Pedobacter sp.]HMI03729.1 baseplate J/gp47 family protein [Pedobacter sp.]
MKPIPSIQQLFSRISADLKNKLSLSDGDLKLVLDACASTLAGELKLCYLYIVDIQRNQFPDTADTAEEGGELNRMGAIKLNRQPRPATDGIYTATVTGITGGEIRAGLTFKSNDNSNSPGHLYITDDAYILPGSAGTITVRSLDPGPEYLLNPGDGLTATEPLIGVDQLITIATVVQIPAAAESTDLYRKTLIDSYRLEPQGGAKTDYRLWSADVQGVQRVFPYLKNGDAGVVQVYVEATPADSTDGYGTPSGALLLAVEDAIEFDPDATLPLNERGRRPIQAIPEVLPVEIKPVDVVISSLQTDNADVRASIRNNMEAYLFSIRPFIAGADLAREKNDILTAVKVQSVVNDTIGNINSFLDFKLFVDGVEINTFTFSGPNIPYLRNVNYN